MDGRYFVAKTKNYTAIVWLLSGHYQAIFNQNWIIIYKTILISAHHIRRLQPIARGRVPAVVQHEDVRLGEALRDTVEELLLLQ